MNYIYYPYYFKKICDDYLLVNMVGEHIFLNSDEFKFMACEKYDKLSDSKIMELVSRNFIVELENREFTEDLLAIKLRSRKDFLNYFTFLHMVVLTLRCNCICDYCHASSAGLAAFNTDMNFEIAKNVLDKIFESPTSEIKIEFQGGEPSLNWDVLKYFVLDAERRIKFYNNRYLNFVICTNLFSLSDEQLEFLVKHNVEISTSCDGTKNMHDLHRKSYDGNSSYDNFVCNLNRVRKSKGANSCDALLTVTKDNLYCLDKVIDEYIYLGFHSVFIRALNPYGYAIKNKKELSYSTEEFLEQYEKALNYILSLNKKGIFFIESYAALLFQRIMTPFSTGFVDLQSPSGAGIAGAIYYYNGDVYPTDEARMLAEMGDQSFKMGNVQRNTFYEIFGGSVIKNLVENSCVESMPECSTCAYSPYCGADPIRYYVESKDIIGKRPDSEFCRKNKGILDILLKFIKENDMETMAIFWSWVNRQPMEEWEICGK